MPWGHLGHCCCHYFLKLSTFLMLHVKYGVSATWWFTEASWQHYHYFIETILPTTTAFTMKLLKRCNLKVTKHGVRETFIKFEQFSGSFSGYNFAHKHIYTPPYSTDKLERIYSLILIKVTSTTMHIKCDNEIFY